MIQKRLMISIWAVLIGLNLFAQNSGTEREVRESARFTSVSAGSGLDVFITQDDQSVEVEATKNQIHRIITEVKGETLHVYVKGNFRWKAKDVRKVYISAPEYKTISASGGADIRGNSPIECDQLALKSSGGGDIYLSVVSKSLKLNCSGGADIQVEGSTETLTASASGGADIDAKKLKAKVVDASASGGADIDVYASESLNARASGGGDINYTGSPKDKKISKSGGGDVSRF